MLTGRVFVVTGTIRRRVAAAIDWNTLGVQKA